MAHFQRPQRPVDPNNPSLDQALVQFTPPNPHRRNDNLALAVRNVTRQPQPKKSTKVLAVVRRRHDQIYLTQDDKGKQMVVQRSHNVAKIQRRQRDENYNPCDLRLRGKQRPVAVGVVGQVDNADQADAMWRARQQMQNAQTQLSQQHKPIQEEKEQRLAEEARLKALEKNERKMRSYRVDMGNSLDTEDNTSAVAQGMNTHHNTAELTHHPDYEVMDEYIDDEVYTSNSGGEEDSETGENVEVMQESGRNSSPGLDHEVSNRPGNTSEVVSGEMLNRYEVRALLHPEYDYIGGESEGEEEEVEEENKDFMGDGQCVVVSGPGQGAANQAPPCRNRSGQGEKEQRRTNMNRQREMNVRERQQMGMEQIIVDTAESRRQAAERIAEEERQKALVKNEQKMKSYKVNMGYSMQSEVPDSSPGPSGVQLVRSSGSTRQNLARSTTSVKREMEDGAPQSRLTKEERERRRQEEMRQKMLAARQRQETQFQKLMQDTEQARRLEAERKAEEARQKALAKNEKKMKSYKVTMGYSLEDYMQDSGEENEQENNAPLDTRQMREHLSEFSTLHALEQENNSTFAMRQLREQLNEFETRNLLDQENNAPLGMRQLRERLSEVGTLHAREQENNATFAMRQLSEVNTPHLLDHERNAMCRQREQINATCTAFPRQCEEVRQSQGQEFCSGVSSETERGGNEIGRVSHASGSETARCGNATPVIPRAEAPSVSNRAEAVSATDRVQQEFGVSLRETSELTEEERNRQFREQMLAARLKKQQEMDLLVARTKVRK